MTVFVRNDIYVCPEFVGQWTARWQPRAWWRCQARQRLGRFVRKTLSFSKCDRLHELALRLFIYQYNQQIVL